MEIEALSADLIVTLHQSFGVCAKESVEPAIFLVAPSEYSPTEMQFVKTDAQAFMDECLEPEQDVFGILVCAAGWATRNISASTPPSQQPDRKRVASTTLCLRVDQPDRSLDYSWHNLIEIDGEEPSVFFETPMGRYPDTIATYLSKCFMLNA